MGMHMSSIYDSLFRIIYLAKDAKPDKTKLN